LFNNEVNNAYCEEALFSDIKKSVSIKFQEQTMGFVPENKQRRLCRIEKSGVLTGGRRENGYYT
jgi:hypothetical protein